MSSRPSLVRLALGAVGVVIAVRGAWMLVTNQRLDQLFSAALWLAGGVAAHDAVLAPVVVVLGWLVIRGVPSWARSAAVVWGLVVGSLTLVAIPVLGAWGRRPDNTSLLPRDYWSGWLIVAAVTVVLCTASALVTRARHRP